ncbi:MAG TPA: hypothetical protein VNO70_19535 [Blastocatellia bacterium]|nr:hypothetical protein [Blastocatellia bacterium]
MKKLVIRLIPVIWITVTAFAQNNVNVAGKWDLTLESPAGTRQMLLTIKQEGDKLSGTMKGTRGDQALDSINVKGDEINFAVTIQYQGQPMVIKYAGKVEKDSMKGEADFGGLATGAWSAVPHQEAAAAAPAAPAAGAFNISGAWNFTVETAAGSGNPTFTFKQEGETLTGTYKGTFGEGPIAGTVKGNDVRFTVKVNFQGQDAEIVYTGKIESATSMKGGVKLGDFGEGTWTGKKQ